MKGMGQHLPRLSLVLLAAFAATLAFRTQAETGRAFILSSAILFAFCAASAIHLLGSRAAVTFIAMGLVIGWFAEQMGATRGWFFGGYTYTSLLGPRIGAVPAIIPFTWFSFVYMAYCIANLIVWRAPVDDSSSKLDIVWMSLLTAAIVTAYDLGLDPYMVYVQKAWIMEKTDGWYFGETVQGFAGWMAVSFAVVAAFRLRIQRIAPEPVTVVIRRDALLPVLAYAGSMVFLMVEGEPKEVRSIVAFAMGIPVLAALAGWRYWRMHGASQLAGEA